MNPMYVFRLICTNKIFEQKFYQISLKISDIYSVFHATFVFTSQKNNHWFRVLMVLKTIKTIY